MKFIKNSIDSEYLQDSISDADLEKHMADCEVESEVVNGHHSEGIKISEKNKMEGVEIAKLSNGVHRKPGSPTKCNGKVNGYYEDEEDFNLVLEDSSEGGESPSKKIYDDGISAPQIVQEIEDLLGINSSSAGIQEELSNLDGVESIEDNLDHEEDIDENQEIQGVCEEIDGDKVEECQGIDNEKKESTEEIQKVTDKTPSPTECDTSSHMNLVFDEVEVGMENGDLHSPNESNVTEKVDEIKCKVASITDTNNEKVKDLVVSETKDTTSQEDSSKVENRGKNEVSAESTSDEIPTTQTSTISESSEDWMVIDAVETSDEEKLSESQVSVPTNIISNELPLAESSGIKDKLKNEAESPLSVLDDNETVGHVAEKISSTSLLCEGDGVRKRCASVDDEEVELKKPKLEDQNCLLESTSPVLKRSLPVVAENESKRTKLSGTTQECKTLGDKDSQVKDKSGKIEEEIETTSLQDTQSTDVQIEDEIHNKSLRDNQITDVPLEDEVKTKSLQDDQITDVPLEDEIKNKPLQDNQITNIPIKNIVSEKSLSAGDETLRDNLSKNKKEETDTIDSTCSDSRKTVENDDVRLPIVIQESQEKLISDVTAPKANDQGNKVYSTSSIESSSSLETSEMNLKEDQPSIIALSKQSSDEVLVDNKKLDCDESKSNTEDKTQECLAKEEKSARDENKENVISSSIDTPKEDLVFKLDHLSSITKKEPTKLDQTKKHSGFSTKSENKIADHSKPVSFTKELSTSIKELEKSLIKSGHEKSLGDLKNTESKKMTNLDFAIERVVEKARIQTEKKVPILKKFHKDQLKKLTRSELEDVVVSKLCEAVTYKSEIGQMRLRTQNLEETNEVWRKKVQQIEKQNRELEMVLKRFLAELSHIKRENQNKVPMPIKVTRSVGLQVVLASSMHGALVSSRSKMNSETAQQQQPQQQPPAKAKQIEKEKEKVKETIKATTFMPPSNSVLAKGRGRPAKTITPQNSRPSTPQSLSPKVTPPTTPAKLANVTPVKTISTPNKDLEVIDLTDKEERAKSASQPLSGSIRVAPSTQVCFVQQNVTPSPPQQPLYLVQKAGQRPQFLVATSSASPQRPMNSVSRPPPALALPVFRAGGHLIPVQTNSQVGVKTNTNTSTSAVARQVPSALRLQPQASVNKHPAPLPTTPTTMAKPGMKAPPPKPQLKIAKTANGIMLSWSMSLTKDMADMQSYQLYAYQEGNQPPSTGLWKKVGDVKALPLPMACTLTQFIEGHKYHFAVRAVDTHGRMGPFSTPSSILLTK